jgi:hypothetical protein
MSLAKIKILMIVVFNSDFQIWTLLGLNHFVDRDMSLFHI